VKHLLTEEKAAQLVAMPKRFVRPADFAWLPVVPQAKAPGKVYRPTNPRIINAKLIALETRDNFELFGNSNRHFSFTLRWQDVDIARIDTNRRHPLPKKPGERTVYVHGPHIHYFVPGHGTDYAMSTSAYSFDDPLGALLFFMGYCGVAEIPPLQETLRFS
jgi:hypothetical protein